MARQGAHGAGFDPPPACDARHLHAALAGQVVDQPPLAGDFGTLPLNSNGTPVWQALMMSAPYSLLRSAITGPPFWRPARKAAHSGDLAIAAPRILVERDRIPLDQVGTGRLDEPGHVLGEVLGGLGHEVAEVAQDLEPDPVLGRHAVGLDQLAQSRVQVLAHRNAATGRTRGG